MWRFRDEDCNGQGCHPTGPVARMRFLTGTAAEVQSIGSVDNIPVGNGNYPVGTALIQKFKEVSSGKSEKYNHWLTYVNS